LLRRWLLLAAALDAALTTQEWVVAVQAVF
jgi:hypothetical protein